MEVKAVERVLETLGHVYPHVSCALTYKDAYTLLVAVVLSAQCTDKAVNKVTPGLFQGAPTPQAMVAMGYEGVVTHIRSLGLYQRKAAHIVELSKLLLQRHGGQVPWDRGALEALPGVGRKTASVVLNVFFHQPSIAVDTHVFRVARRLGWSQGTTPLAVERDLEACIPPPWKPTVSLLLIQHGREICKAQPLCGLCPLKAWCLKVTHHGPKG